MRFAIFLFCWLLSGHLLYYLKNDLLALKIELWTFLDRRRILKSGNFLELLIYEFEMCKRNTIKNLDKVLITNDYEKCEAEFIKTIESYGIYIVHQSQYNANNKWDMFTLCILQVFFAFCFGSLSETPWNIFTGILIVIIYSWFVLTNNPLNKNSYIFKMGDICNNTLLNYKCNNKKMDINIGSYVIEEDFKNSLVDYFSAIKKIQTEQNKLYEKGYFILVDMFNIEEEQLLNKYYLNSQEISSYNKIKDLRAEYFKRNSLTV